MKHRGQGLAASRLRTTQENKVKYADDSAEPPLKKSKMVGFKVSPDRLLLATSPSHLQDIQLDHELSSTLSSTPASMPPSPTHASAPHTADGQYQDAQTLIAPVPGSSQNTSTVSTSQASTATQSSHKGLCKIPDFFLPSALNGSLPDASQHFQGRFACPTSESAAHQNLDILLKSNEELQGPRSVDEESYVTQSTLLLGHTGPSMCDNCGRIDHNPQDCVDRFASSQSNASSSHLHHWLQSQNVTGCNRQADSRSFVPVASSSAGSEATMESHGTLSPLNDDARFPLEYHQLRTIAEQLLAQRKMGPDKPDPLAQPEVWAEGRQELCETLHFYRSYQGACYSTGGFVRGLMFDEVAHKRDYMDSNVVISRAGGGMTKDKTSGLMKAGKDQAEDSTALALKNCIRHRNPVVIITGVNNPHIPSKPPHQYCVLDYFKPTHIWVEKSDGVNIVRYRFEKIDTKKGSWWQAKDSSEAVELGSLSPPVEKTCGTCGVVSQQVYLNGWMCLQSICHSFWKLILPDRGNKASFQEPNEASLIYDPRFLKQKTPWQNDDQEYTLVSNTAELSKHAIPGEDTAVAFSSGIVCPNCGRCISRINWTNWECSSCDYKRTPPHALISALSLRDPLWPVTNSYTQSRDTLSPLIDFDVQFAHGYRINKYIIPGIDGFIVHMIANKAVLEERGGPDAMFEELQQTDIGLKRRPMPDGQLKGPKYCRQFLVNYGMPYKFVAATQSHSFDEAAHPITNTRSRLNWAAKILLSQDTGKSMQAISASWQDQEFNEVLALGYFQEQKIAYHDDGEHGLGPTIATLSLGASGTMRVRMKARHYHGISSATGPYDDVPPIPGCEQYDARLALQPSLDALKSSNSKACLARRKQIPKELGLHCRGQAKDALVMQLGHGDVVVMHGAGIQKYYEHSVDHSGSLRFALTCRYIDPESLGEKERPAYEVKPDLEGYDGSKLA